MRRATLALSLLCVGSACLPFHTALPPRSNAVPNRVVTWPSGLRVVIERHAGSGRVGVALLVGAGASDDPAGKSGTAHFVEHLAFRSKPVNRLSAWDELDFAGVASNGGSTANGATSLDSTVYSGVVAADRLGEVLPLITSMVLHPLQGVDAATLEIERAVVSNEYLERYPHGGGAVLATLGELAFGPVSRAARPISGDPKSLAAITRADLEHFVETYYRPETTTLVLVGDVEPTDAERLARKAFPASWVSPGTPTPPFERFIEKPGLPRPFADRPVLEVDVRQRELVFVWAVPGPAGAAYSAMPLVADAMADALARNLAGDAAVLGVGGQFLPGLFAPMITLTVAVAPGADLDQLSARARAKPLDWRVERSDEHDRAFGDLLARQDLLAEAESRASSTYWKSERPLRLTDAGWAELTRLGREALVWRGAAELLLVPRVVASSDRGERGPAPQAERKNVVVEPARMAATALPASLPDVHEATLPNGLRVVVSRRLPVPVASVTLAMPLGARHTTREVSELAGVMLEWWDNFPPEHPATLPRPDVVVQPDVTTVTLTAEARLLPLVLDVFAHNLPPRVGVNRVWAADRVVERLRRRADQPLDASDGLRDLLLQVLPPGSAHVEATLDDLRDISLGDFDAFVGDAFRAKGAVLFIDGDVDVEPTLALVNELFSSWGAGSGRTGKLRELGAVPTRPAKPLVVDRPDAAQTSVRVACRLPPATTLEQRGGSLLLGEALAMVFEDDLRRARGLTYGVSAEVTDFALEDNLLLLTTNLDARNKQQGLADFFTRLDSLDGALWEDQVVDLARWRLAKRNLGSLLTSRVLARSLAREMARGSTLQAAAGLPRTLASVPLKWVDEAWAACSDTLAVQVVGQRSTIDPVLSRRKR